MQPEAEELFHQLADLTAAERERYFTDHLVSSALRAEVERLLQFDSPSDHLLTESVLTAADRSLNRSMEGARCGPYQLKRAIGRGGMGAVYLAERADGEVQQTAAIKLLRYGGDEPAFRDRFLRERQILASLNHPGVGKLFDAGHTGDGQPYLAMEYIDGSPIDVFAARLSVREKVAIFIPVCEAVSYAHRNLIVHRDLKPSNILVDASGRPKLLDFGIAKMLDAETEQTRTRERLLTPEYASPEQVRGGAQTTATDLYSLGAVLYKLLTGQSPHTIPSDNIEEAICLRETVPPSQLSPEVPKDLDFVVGKALRKEPEERYASADAFADDLRAFLEFRPVRARSGNAWYRTRKFVRRYRLPVGAAALTIVGLSVGLYIANRERNVAQRRFTEVRQLAQKMISLDADIRDLPGATEARNRIVSTALEYLAALGPEARGDKDLALEIAAAYRRVAGVQGVPGSTNLGKPREAEESLRKGDVFVDSILSSNPQDERALLESARIADSRFQIAYSESNLAEALKQAHKAETTLDRLANRRDLQPDEIQQMTQAYYNAGAIYSNNQQYDDSIRADKKALELSRNTPSARLQRGRALSALGNTLYLTGDLDGSLEALRESLKIRASASTSSVGDRLSMSLAFWGEGRILADRYEAGFSLPESPLDVLQKAADIGAEIAAADPNDALSRIRLAAASRELARLLIHRHPARSAQVYDQAIARIREVKTGLARDLEVALLTGSTYALRQLRREDEVRQRIEAAFRILRESKAYPAESISPVDMPQYAVQALADHYAATGRLEQAADTYRELLNKMNAAHSDREHELRAARRFSECQAALAAILQRLGRIQEAAAVEAQRQELWRPWLQRLPNNAWIRYLAKTGDPYRAISLQ